MLTLCMMASVLFFSEEKTDVLTWKELTRDVYVDGRLNKEARAYYCYDFGYAVDLPGARDVILIERGEGVYPVTLLKRKSFNFSKDRLDAEVPAKLKGRSAGEAAVIDGKHLLLEANGVSVLLARHEGTSGVLTEDALWEVVPSWADLVERYEPDPEVVRQIRAVKEPVHLNVYLGTWCGDSKNHVPKVLKTLQQAGNPNISVELIALASGFHEPWDRIREDRITNVPTFIAVSEGEELGRLVEDAQGSSMSHDLVEVLNASFLARPGDDDRGEPVASGSWSHKNAMGALSATEHWHLYKRKGGNSLYSRVMRGEAIFDVWVLTDENKHLVFMEITETLANQTSRARYSLGDGKLSVTLRGGNRGIVRQKLSHRGVFIPQTPSAMVNGWLAGAELEAENDRYVAEPLLGRLEALSQPTYTEDWLSGYLGRIRTTRMAWSDQTWWRHEGHQIPVRMETAEGDFAELTYLQWLGQADQASAEQDAE